MAFAKNENLNLLDFFKSNFWNILLMVYLVGSAIFIIFYVYYYLLVGYYYNSWVRDGATQLISDIAISLQQSNCSKPISLPVGQGQSIAIIDANCMSPVPAPQPTN